MTDDPQHVVAVTAMVFDAAGRVLLVKGDRRGWEPPGGQVELGEDLFTALKREVREEAGCEVEVGELLSVNSNLGRPEMGVPEMVVLAFTCEWVGGESRGEASASRRDGSPWRRRSSWCWHHSREPSCWT